MMAPINVTLAASEALAHKVFAERVRDLYAASPFGFAAEYPSAPRLWRLRRANPKLGEI